MKKRIFGFLYGFLLFLILGYIFYGFIYFFNYYVIYNYRLNKIKVDLRKLEYQLAKDENSGVSTWWLKWPKTIVKNFEIKKFKFLYKDNLFNDFNDIYRRDINYFCDKIKESSDLKYHNNFEDFKEFASRTLVLLNNYQPSPIDSNSVIKDKHIGKQGFMNLTNYLYSASIYYASLNDNRTALLLSYLPVILIQEFEASNIEGGNPYTKLLMMEFRNKACMNLLFLANHTSVDKEIAVKISKNLLELVKNEPSLVRYVDYTKSRVKRIFKRVEDNYSRNNANYFIENICNTEEWQKYTNGIYDNLIEVIKNVESGHNPHALNAWQQDIQNYLIENNSFINKDFYYQTFNWKRNITLYVMANFPETFYINYYDLYRKREEYLAITEGTAIALALAAYSSDKNKDDINDSMPNNINELSKWMEMELPIDRMSKSPYQFYFADDFFLAGSPSEEKQADSYFQNYVPYLKNKWVENSEPSVSGNPIPKLSNNPINERLSRLDKLQKNLKALEEMKKTINKLANPRSRINF